jgi:signal transduction histidine kinase
MINACVSHELRNPLNSIRANTTEQKYLYKLIDEYLQNENFSKETLITNLRNVMKKLN